ncbi:MAG TPA: tetratricopeptide repeat protein [Caulobacteraceae bacterium]|jgi:tetratricopeptide (TPR) repeat protein|nr:tetratricopeptide repeat protein [Caulobacteraceae bacterium]
MRASVIGAVAVLGALAMPAAAVAQAIQVFGGGWGEACWRAALASTFLHMDSAAMEARWKADSILICDDALSSGAMDRRDTAATYVNRGILEMSRERYDVAEKNFTSALVLLPKLAEAHVDLGSTLINMKKYDEGVRETELGLQLGSKEPERGYYNLGIAYERLGNIQKAYESYRQASMLDPKWQEPKDEMARFVVRPVQK